MFGGWKRVWAGADESGPVDRTSRAGPGCFEALGPIRELGGAYEAGFRGGGLSGQALRICGIWSRIGNAVGGYAGRIDPDRSDIREGGVCADFSVYLNISCASIWQLPDRSGNGSLTFAARKTAAELPPLQLRNRTNSVACIPHKSLGCFALQLDPDLLQIGGRERKKDSRRMCRGRRVQALDIRRQSLGNSVDLGPVLESRWQVRLHSNHSESTSTLNPAASQNHRRYGF